MFLQWSGLQILRKLDEEKLNQGRLKGKPLDHANSSLGKHASKLSSLTEAKDLMYGR